MIEVTIFQADRKVASAEADDADSAVFAAQTMWNEHRAAVGFYGSHKAMRTTFHVDGTLVRMIEGRRAS